MVIAVFLGSVFIRVKALIRRHHTAPGEVILVRYHLTINGISLSMYMKIHTETKEQMNAEQNECSNAASEALNKS